MTQYILQHNTPRLYYPFNPESYELVYVSAAASRFFDSFFRSHISRPRGEGKRVSHFRFPAIRVDLLSFFLSPENENNTSPFVVVLLAHMRAESKSRHLESGFPASAYVPVLVTPVVYAVVLSAAG